jgi:hypothetical protein
MSATTTDTASAVAALRVKLTRDPRDGITAINLTRKTRTVGMWPLKRDAETALRTLQARGLNVGKDVRILRAYTGLGRPYAITRIGEFSEVLIMAEDGSWVAGRLFAERPGDRGAVWDPYDSARAGETIPPTFTHITSTALMAGRTERYKTKSNGSCGRWVVSDESVGRCTCGWKTYAGSRAEAQAAARAHRDKVA